MKHPFKLMRRLAMTGLICATSFCAANAAPLSSAKPQEAEAGGNTSPTFTVGDGRFIYNGKPVTVKAAELHYPRIPRPYWEQRIQMCKALGMNAVCLYVFWNAHENTPGEFDFSGQNDLRSFVELCRDNGLMVILRPGPYVCAEWEMGGLPWWLLRDKDIALRENDPRFIDRVGKFMNQVAAQVGDLTVDNGGPIVMVQVENEYGSYGINKEYISLIRDMVRANFGDKVVLFQCDWSSNFTDNGLDDLLWTMNFGTGADISREFARLKELRPDSPLMCSEFWSGWFDKWGANHETRPADDMIAGIDSMLTNNISFSLYMTHGGTNWGHWAGANSPGFAPDVTSYDYDAPINEWGQPTDKYWKLRALMERHNDGQPLPALPQLIPTTTIDSFTLDSVAPLFGPLVTDGLPVDGLPTMEDMNQGYGSILYTTVLNEASDGETTLKVTEPHDFAQVWLDGIYIGKIDRRAGESSLRLPPFRKDSRLDILVEAMGRINFGRAIKDFKGITDKVELIHPDGNITQLLTWQVALLPDEEAFYLGLPFFAAGEDADKMGAQPLWRSSDGRMPGVYKGVFTVDRPADTFLDFSRWGKGLVYVNGHPLGRFWEIGPQQTLYMPGCWLRQGENEIVVLDIIGPRERVVSGLDQPLLDNLGGDAVKGYDPDMRPDLTDAIILSDSILSPGNGWQTINFDNPGRGRYFCLEMTSSHDGGAEAAIAEIYLVDSAGNRLPRENWKARYASSENRNGNHTLDKGFDLQESTYWSTAPADSYPHLIVIDLGENANVAAMQLLPRMEQGAPGAPARFKVYMID